MKKMYTIGFFVLILFLCGATYATTVDEAYDERFSEQVKAIISLANKEKLDVAGWRVRAKGTEQQVKGDFQELISAFQSDHPSFQRVSSETNGEHMSVVFAKDNDLGAREEIKFYASQSPSGHVLEKSYELIANTSKVDFNENEFKERLDELEMESVLLFYQLTAETDNLMNDSLDNTARHYVEELGASEQEALTEETFVSLSAYNGKWGGGIALNDEKTMNVQVALRQNPDLGARTTVTLGTPIITTEY